MLLASSAMPTYHLFQCRLAWPFHLTTNIHRRPAPPKLTGLGSTYLLCGLGSLVLVAAALPRAPNCGVLPLVTPRGVPAGVGGGPDGVLTLRLRLGPSPACNMRVTLPRHRVESCRIPRACVKIKTYSNRSSTVSQEQY